MATNGDANVSWRLTRPSQLLGIEYPIIQARFAGLPSQHLTATVSNLGGFGSLEAVMPGGPPMFPSRSCA
jgi:NAD(P)H-dependent flavin oxidoreductase YrpB (nitropropane dioxygenase family)